MSCDRGATSYVIKGAVHIIDLPTRKKHVRMNFDGEVRFWSHENAKAWLKTLVSARVHVCQKEWGLPEEKIVLNDETTIVEI